MSRNTPPTVAARDNQLRKTGLGRDAQEFFTAATDPFHDARINFEGIPDSNNRETVGEVLRRTFQINAPAGTTGNWTFVLFNTDLDRAIEAAWTRKSLGKMRIAPATDPAASGFIQKMAADVECPGNMSEGFQIGTINVWKWMDEDPDGNHQYFPTGQPGFIEPDEVEYMGVLDDKTFLQVADDGESLSSSEYRVASIGIEMRNTTATLTKQGTITGVRVPNSQNMADVFFVSTVAQCNNGDNALLGNITGLDPNRVIQTTFPPSTLSSAMNNGAIQGTAAKGAYSVVTSDIETNKLSRDQLGSFQLTSGQHLPVTNPTPANFTVSDANSVGNLPSSTFLDSSNTRWNQLPLTPSRIHTTQRDTIALYASGLSVDSTFTITVKFFVEIAPRDYDLEMKALVPLRRVPPAENERALQLYQHVGRKLPAFVPVGMNPSGEFWSSVMDLVKDALPVVGGLFGPEGAMLGEVAKKVADVIMPKVHAETGRIKATVNRVAGQVGGVKSADQGANLIRRRPAKPAPRRAPAARSTKKKGPPSRAV